MLEVDSDEQKNQIKESWHVRLGGKEDDLKNNKAELWRLEW